MCAVSIQDYEVILRKLSYIISTGISPIQYEMIHSIIQVLYMTSTICTAVSTDVVSTAVVMQAICATILASSLLCHCCRYCAPSTCTESCDTCLVLLYHTTAATTVFMAVLLFICLYIFKQDIVSLGVSANT
jgi:hypothetical protein